MTSRGRNRALKLACLGAGLWGSARLATQLLDREPAPVAIENRFWIDHMPHDQRDLVRQFVPLVHQGRQFGVMGRASHWRVHLDRFLWEKEGDRLRFRFPQDDRRLELAVRSWSCKGEAPAPFELCLELSRGDWRRRLYSRNDWKVGPRDTSALPAELAAPALPEAPADVPPRAGSEETAVTPAALDDLFE